MDGLAAERENGNFSRVENGENTRGFCTATEKVRSEEKAEQVEKEMPVAERMLEFCFFFATTALQLVNESCIDEDEHITQLRFDVNSDAGKLRRHVKKTGKCKRILIDSRDGSRLGNASQKRLGKAEAIH